MHAPFPFFSRLVLGVFIAGAVVSCTSTKPSVRPESNAGEPPPAMAEHSPSDSGPKVPEQPKISSRATLQFEEANKFMEQQKHSGTPDYATAARKYEAAVAADERLAEADYNLGVISERQGNIPDAEAHFKTALSKKPSLRAAAEGLARVAESRGDTQAALSGYEDVAKQYPDDARSRARIASMLQKAGDDDQALEYSRQALMRDPKSLLALKAMMNVFINKREFPMARLVALRALKVSDSDPELYQAIGLVFTAEKQPDKARVQFTKALSVRPEFLPAHLMLAKLALKDEDYPRAQGHLGQILKTDPQNAQAHLDMGVAWKGMGKYDQALAEYDAAEKLDPKLAGIYLNRGIILHHFKDSPEKGLALYRKYIELKGGDVAVPAGSPVFALVKEADQVIAAKAEAAKMEGQQKKLEEAQRRQQEELKRQQPSTAPNSAEPVKGKGPVSQAPGTGGH